MTNEHFLKKAENYARSGLSQGLASSIQMLFALRARAVQKCQTEKPT